MKILRLLAPLAIAAMAVSGAVAIAQQGGSSSAPSAGIAGQREESNSLEIAPQPGAKPQRPAVQEIPGGKNYEPGEDTDSINQKTDLENDLRNQSHRMPYLGITVQYSTQCYLGMEEHGLEVLKVDPNSPASAAGVHSRTSMTAVGAVGMTAGTLLGPVSILVNPLLEKTGQLGLGGDLIVAIDDRRVRSQRDLDEAMERLKPGDTMYLTVIRPLPRGEHKTLKIAVRVGTVDEPYANAGSPPIASKPMDMPH